VTGVLGQILERKRAEVSERRARRPAGSLLAAARAAGPAYSLEEALSPRGGPLRIIAEIKRASPSAGDIRPGASARELALAYERGGASAISVLTDGPSFGGSLADLEDCSSAVGLPLLRKDFVLDAYQLIEARAAGASAALLIVAALDDRALAELLSAARELGLSALVECHDERELGRALAAGAAIVGINSRDLRTLEVDLSVAERLLPMIPPGTIAVAESGVRGPADVARLRRAGASNLLVGQALSGSDDPGAALRRLLGATS
jgi:indole-3-glycerol phosphate synthase